MITTNAIPADFPRGTVERPSMDKFLAKHYNFTESELDYVKDMLDIHERVRNVWQGDDRGFLEDLLVEEDESYPQQWSWMYDRIVIPGQKIDW